MWILLGADAGDRDDRAPRAERGLHVAAAPGLQSVIADEPIAPPDGSQHVVGATRVDEDELVLREEGLDRRALADDHARAAEEVRHWAEPGEEAVAHVAREATGRLADRHDDAGGVPREDPGVAADQEAATLRDVPGVERTHAEVAQHGL